MRLLSLQQPQGGGNNCVYISEASKKTFFTHSCSDKFARSIVRVELTRLFLPNKYYPEYVERFVERFIDL